MKDYESKKFIAKADNIMFGELLDIWAEEELKVGTLSNGTVKGCGGKIRVESVVEKGTEFEIIFSVQRRQDKIWK